MMIVILLNNQVGGWTYLNIVSVAISCLALVGGSLFNLYQLNSRKDLDKTDKDQSEAPNGRSSAGSSSIEMNPAVNSK